MKLCKDCKHALMQHPHQLQQISGEYYGVPMCAHPDAPRNCVDGRLEATCFVARGVVQSLQQPTFCGPDAKLFEEKPAPEPAPDAGATVYDEWAQKTIERSWICRLFGW